MKNQDDVSGQANVYNNVGFIEDQNLETFHDPSWKKMDLEGWHVVPWGLRKLLEWIDDRYNKPPIIVTENGCSYNVSEKDGLVDDHDRIVMLNDYIKECQKVFQKGVKLEGYFVWSLFDNYEWALGYKEKFGLFHISAKTLRRTPKSSAGWYRKVIASNGEEIFK